MKKGNLIVIEGACDGIGKSTQYDILYNHLKKDGQKVVNHHFPTYNSYQGTPVEKYLAGEFGEIKDNSPYFIHALYALDRAITWKKELAPAYQNGDIILLDRYTTSSLIYQSAIIENIEERKAFLDFISDYEYDKLGIQKPDYVIFLTASFDTITKFRNARKDNDGIQNDLHERNLEFMKKVYENAVFVASYLKWNIIECDNNGVFKTKEEIHEEIYRLIRKK